jgi:hypothetical protein
MMWICPFGYKCKLGALTIGIDALATTLPAHIHVYLEDRETEYIYPHWLSKIILSQLLQT